MKRKYRSPAEMAEARQEIIDTATKLHAAGGVIVQREMIAGINERRAARGASIVTDGRAYAIVGQMVKDGTLPRDWFYCQTSERQAFVQSVVALAQTIHEDGGTFTLRQLYYRAVVAGLVAKTDGGYRRLAETTADLRKSGEMPYDWFSDSTRPMHVWHTDPDPETALTNLAEQYAENPWLGRDAAVEIWTEKDALTSVIMDATGPFYVPLRVARGYQSLTGIHRAAEDIRERADNGQETHIFYLRDRDTDGVAAAAEGERMLREMLNGAVYIPPFSILGVTDEQVASNEWELQAALRTDKKTGEETAIEVDAIPPAALRQLVKGAITKFLPERDLKKHEARVEKIRDQLRAVEIQS